jgi:hypothetical protein
VLIEEQPQDWSVDLYTLMQERGYTLTSRSRRKAILQL